jgi:ribosomal protein S17
MFNRRKVKPEVGNRKKKISEKVESGKCMPLSKTDRRVMRNRER